MPDQGIKNPPMTEQIAVIGKGTVLGLLGRWATWPFEKGMYKASQKSNQQSLLQIYQDVFKPSSLYQLNKIFFKTGFLQTIGKASSNMGVIEYVNYYHPNLRPFQRALLTTWYSAPLEGLFTSYHEFLKIRSFLATKNNMPANKSTISLREFSRV